MTLQDLMDIVAGWGVDADQVKIRVRVSDDFYDTDDPDVVWVDDGDGGLWLSIHADPVGIVGHVHVPAPEPEGGWPRPTPHPQGTDKLNQEGNPA